MEPGETHVTLRRDRSVVVVESIPALVCVNCGEASMDADTAQAVYDLAEREIKRGVSIEFLTFAA
jgi:YgiT-type zinc finger domain-containing protein